MLPYYIWTLRLWFVDVNCKRRGVWRLEFEWLSRKRFVGKREVKFFTHEF